jgi:hypothetical protein
MLMQQPFQQGPGEGRKGSRLSVGTKTIPENQGFRNEKDRRISAAVWEAWCSRSRTVGLTSFERFG